MNHLRNTQAEREEMEVMSGAYTVLHAGPVPMVPSLAPLPDWVAGTRDEHVVALPHGDGRESDRERIACLECIIAVLLEKNERIRQQLRTRTD
jgi:hypothetical protein